MLRDNSVLFGMWQADSRNVGVLRFGFGFCFCLFFLNNSWRCDVCVMYAWGAVHQKCLFCKIRFQRISFWKCIFCLQGSLTIICTKRASKSYDNAVSYICKIRDLSRCWWCLTFSESVHTIRLGLAWSGKHPGAGRSGWCKQSRETPCQCQSALALRHAPESQTSR